MMPINCNFCAACCSLVVRLTKKEIALLRKQGFKPEYFLDKDAEGKDVVKQINNYCIFLEIKEGRGFCRVYKARPKPCRDYPGKKICKLVRKFRIEEVR